MRTRIASLTDEQLQALVVRAHYRVSDIARECHIQPRTVQRFFVARFGVAPRVWMDSVRMRRVQRGIVRGELLKALAAEVGYADQSSLTRHYKAAYGTTPSSVRSQENAP